MEAEKNEDEKAIVATDDKHLVDSKKIDEYLDAFGLTKQLQPNEVKIFKEIAVAYQLNPFKREIYCVAYNSKQGRKLSIITGYEVYLKRASRVGTLDGWYVTTEGTRKDNSLKAIVTINRKDWKKPFIHEVYWLEYNQGNSMWNSKPVTMTKKVAIAQAFRMCFPDEFDGMPCTADELPDEMTIPKDVTPIQEENETQKTDGTPKKVGAETVASLFGGTIQNNLNLPSDDEIF